MISRRQFIKGVAASAAAIAAVGVLAAPVEQSIELCEVRWTGVVVIEFGITPSGPIDFWYGPSGFFVIDKTGQKINCRVIPQT